VKDDQGGSRGSALGAWAHRAREAVRYDGLLFRRMAFAGATRFPEWFRRGTPALFGEMFCELLPEAREAVERNQARLLGLAPGSPEARAAARAVFVEYAHCITDAFEMAGRPSREFEYACVDEHYFEEARARGRGLVLVTAHTGSWEVSGYLLSQRCGVPTTLVMAAEPNEGARAYAERLRRRGGVDVVYASGHDPATALTLLSRLRKNEAIAIQLDRPPASATVVEARLCDLAWPVPEGPFRLAQAAGAPVVPVFARRAGYRRHMLTMCAPIDVPRRGDPDALRHAAQQAVSALERFVRAHPEQWFHFASMPAG
jgi:KDO2-lipid IV(A) lauroyltransferase